MPHVEGDAQITVLELRASVKQFVEERDWDQFHDPKELAAAIAIEAAELQELFLWKDSLAVANLANDVSGLNRILEELADILILSLSLANQLDIDLSSAVLDKLEKNRVRYPVEKAWGTAKKYTEL